MNRWVAINILLDQIIMTIVINNTIVIVVVIIVVINNTIDITIIVSDDDDVDNEIIVVVVVSEIIMIIFFMAIIPIIENIIFNRPFLEKKLSYECNMVTISKFDTQKMLNKVHYEEDLIQA